MGGGMDWNGGGGGGWGDQGSNWGGNGMMEGKGGGKGYGKNDGYGKGGGKDKGKSKAPKVVYVGEVKSYSPDKKHGYIVSERVAVEANQDVYAFQDVLQKGNAGPGDTVAFFLHWSARGQPQASNPMLRIGAGDGGYALKGMIKKADMGEDLHIHCPEVRDMLQCDVRIPVEQMQMLAIGQIVCFNCNVGHDGIPMCETMELCEAEWEPLPVDLTQHRVVETRVPSATKGGKGSAATWSQDQSQSQFGKGGDDWYGKGGDKGGKGKTKGGGGGPPEPTGKMYTGTLKSFNDLNNYGFIECPEVRVEYGNDVFAHGKMLQPIGVQVGQVVYFELGISSKGQPQAINVSLADGNGEPAAKKQKLEEQDWSQYGDSGELNQLIGQNDGVDLNQLLS